MVRLSCSLVFLIVFSTSAWAQADSLNLYSVGRFDIDTTLFVTIRKDSRGISFAFPIVEGVVLYTIKNGTKVDSCKLPDIQSIYGPYKFKKKKKKIVFQDKNISNKFRDLYELTDSLHSCPYLFSTSTDSYSIQNKLMDLNGIINIGEMRLSCFRFFQAYFGHNPIRDKYYRILYIDKTSLIPIRIENYYDKECKYLRSSVFAREYVKL